MSDLTESFIDQIKTAADDNQALNIVGNGTKSFLGRSVLDNNQVPVKTISTSDHTGIIEYEPVELVMSARAGTTLAEIDVELEKNNQYLACDPARFDGRATIGGSLAANQSGPSRPWYGSLRDHVLGVNLINGQGEHLRFGGKVMKNVAGYDVSRLQAGAMGTLGLMTEVSFKVLPKPAESITLVRSVSLSESITVMNELAGQPKPLAAACWFDGALYLQLCGAKSSVVGTAEKWQGDVLEKMVGDRFWVDVREHSLEFFNPQTLDQALWRFSINPSAPSFLENESWLLNWGGSERWLKGDFDSAQLQALARQHGGEVVLYRGGDRAQEIFHQPNSVMKKLQKNIKNSFDPNNVFNPGRLYSWM